MNEQIKVEEITKKCNEITLLAEHFHNVGDKLFEISTACTEEVISMDGDKFQEKIDEVALSLKNTYLQILTITTQIKQEALKQNKINNQ